MGMDMINVYDPLPSILTTGGLTAPPRQPQWALTRASPCPYMPFRLSHTWTLVRTPPGLHEGTLPSMQAARVIS
jgi:hypothetical protein